MDDTVKENKGPRGYRISIFMLNLLLGILIYWFIGFVLDDIRTQPGPSWKKIADQTLNPIFGKQEEILLSQIRTLETANVMGKQKQNLLQTNINSYRDTMKQLLELQKNNLQKNIVASSNTQENIDRATKLYLSSQQAFQKLNAELTNNAAKLETLYAQEKKISARKVDENKNIDVIYQKNLFFYNLKLALYKLFFLIPILSLSLFLYIKKRATPYGILFLSPLCSSLIWVIDVMHEHFPSRLFKYIFILVLILFVIKSLLGLTRMIAAPQKKWLLKQYKEAYKKLCCPTCDYAIYPDLFKFIVYLQGKSHYAVVDINAMLAVKEYSCPACGERLFEKCEACNHTRHSLLPFCEHCGVEKCGSSH